MRRLPGDRAYAWQRPIKTCGAGGSPGEWCLWAGRLQGLAAGAARRLGPPGRAGAGGTVSPAGRQSARRSSPAAPPSAWEPSWLRGVAQAAARGPGRAPVGGAMVSAGAAGGPAAAPRCSGALRAAAAGWPSQASRRARGRRVACGRGATSCYISGLAVVATGWCRGIFRPDDSRE